MCVSGIAHVTNDSCVPRVTRVSLVPCVSLVTRVSHITHVLHVSHVPCVSYVPLLCNIVEYHVISILEHMFFFNQLIGRRKKPFCSGAL